MILDDFEKNFNISAQIVYDSKTNIIKSNPEFKIGNSAAGFQDTNSKTIYFFSDVIEKIRNKNYYKKSGENDNGLTYLILASFHELEHYIQRVHPEKLRVEKLSQKLTAELGKGFIFVGSQVRLTLEEDHFYPDLVFYNRILKCFVIIDLKIGKVTHQDIGQMQMYVNYYDREIKSNDENLTVGILLSTLKNKTVVKYTLPEDDKNIFSSSYKLHLPTEQELIDAVEEEKKNLELNES